MLKLELFPLKHILVLQWNEKQLVLFAIRASVELEVTHFVTVEKIVNVIFVNAHMKESISPLFFSPLMLKKTYAYFSFF